MFKCQICGKKFNELPSLYNHLESKHKEMIPKDMSVQQYYYFMKTGKRNGNCVMCKKPTTWNKNTNKYNRFCGDPKCKDEYVKIVKGRMVAKYGKVHLLNDPNKQREMLANRSISGKYTWSNSTVETTYTGSYELDFLKMLDLFFEWDPVDISMPSPHTYTYEYQGEQKFYIPDAFIHSLGLEIEIKDGGDNPNNHHKIQAVDKEKERLKDEVMTSQKMFHYVKITNKNYSNFFDFLKEIKEEYGKHDDEKDIKRIFKIEDIKTKSKPVNESYEIIEENYLFNEDDIYLNIDKFERGEKHILFITGHSGSGKSTLAKSLAKKYNAEYVELDRLTAIDDKDFIKNTVFEEYVKQKGLENFSPANLNDDEFAEFVSDFIDWLIHERTHQKLVVEGIQVFCVGNPHIIKDYPIIIKNVSVFNSIIRARKRDYNNWLSFIKGLPKEIYWRITDDKYFRKFKKEINESYEIIEEGNVFEDIILKLRRRSLEENRAFINMAYNVKKDNPEEMKKYIMKMGKEFNYKKDLLVIKDIVDTTEKYYKQKAKENPEFKQEYFDFVKWYDKKLRWEIEYRLKHIKESTEYVEENLLDSKDDLENFKMIEEKFEPDKFLVWFDKPLKKALGGKIRIYRGSSKLIEKEYIDPMSLNVGATKFSEPRWSSYFWDNREDAMCWEATWAVSEHHKYTLYMGHNGKTLLGKPDGVDDKTFVKDLIEKMSNFKFYIYECEVDIRDLEIGSVPTIKEYTVSKPVKILKRFEYKLNKEIVRRCFEILPVDEVIKYKEENKGVKRFDLHRNFILNSILDRNRDSYRAIMRTDLQQGNINIGDNLSDYKYSINRHVKNDTYNLREEYTKESTEYVEENLLVSKDNLEFNLENFNQNNNILFITGLGGSGKSTIISEYATKYNAQPLEYDAVTSALIKGLENLNKNKIHPIILEYLEKENPRKLNGFSDPNFNKECVKFLNWFEANYSNDGNLYVLEGMQIFLCFNPERFKDKPIVIMGTSVTKSMFRSVSRTYKRSHGDIIRTFKFFLKTIKRFPIFVKNDKRIDELIDTIQESYDDIYEDYIHESSISISHINKCLQQDTDRLLKEYLQDYTDFYHRMMKEQPASIPHINEDIKKAILAIDDLSKKENVNNDLLKSAKWCLGDLVNLNKNSSPIKQSKHTQSLVEGYHKIITPGSTIWVGADWHFYTGYNDQLKENPNIDRLVNNFNAKVKDTDVVIFIGDLYDARRLFDLNKLPKLDRIKKLKGYKIIVKGNHDVADDDIYYKMGFDEVCERYEVGNVIFTHEPCEVKANQVNVHGHLHYSKSYWYIKPTSHIDAYTARFDYQPMLVEDVVLNYNDGFLKPQAMDKFIKTFHVNKSSVKECYEPEYNELINGIRIKLVTENLNKRSFGIMDKNTRIIINDKYTIQRDNGLRCSVRPVVEGYENKEVMEFEIKYNSNIDIEQLINETLDIGLTIGGLYIPTDKENKLIQEVCLKLFGSYPDKCNFYK